MSLTPELDIDVRTPLASVALSERMTLVCPGEDFGGALRELGVAELRPIGALDHHAHVV